MPWIHCRVGQLVKSASCGYVLQKERALLEMILFSGPTTKPKKRGLNDFSKNKTFFPHSVSFWLNVRLQLFDESPGNKHAINGKVNSLVCPQSIKNKGGGSVWYCALVCSMDCIPKMDLATPLVTKIPLAVTILMWQSYGNAYPV